MHIWPNKNLMSQQPAVPPLDPRMKLLMQMLKELPAGASIEKVLPEIPKFLKEFDQNQTNDTYFNLSFFTANVLIECAPKIEDYMISRVNICRRLLEIVISWGIYPHLPKSLHIKFLDDPHWIETVAPPRLLRPKQEMLDALEIVLNTDGLALIHPLFVQHAICIFYYLEPEKLSSVIEMQRTDTIIASILALIPTGLKLMNVLVDIIKERNDSFEAIEESQFPPKLCGRAIAAVPENDDPAEYFQKLLPRVFNAINADKGAIVAKCILAYVIKFNLNHFYNSFDLKPLIEWPTEENIAPLLWKLENYFFSDDLQKLLIPPMPQRIVLIAALTTGEINTRAINILKSYMKSSILSIELIKSIAENATLSPIGLDNFTIVHNDNGLFAIEEERDDDFDIISQMLTILAELYDIKDTIDIVNKLPSALNGFHFVSQALARFKEIDDDIAVCLLTYISKLNTEKEIGSDIARLIIEMCPKLKEVPQCVVDSLGELIPEIKLYRIIGSEPENTKQEDFDKVQLLQDLTSPIVPLRARGLFTLRKGVMKVGHPLRDEETIKSIFPTIERELKHDDTFVFLNAIFCLESIADVFPHLVIETLTAQFPQKDIDLSLKVGQVLMLCARRTGPGLIHSADGNLCGHFIKAFARGIDHDSSLVQASSLSDLATFVEALSFGCYPWFTDIVTTVCNTWQIHHTIEVRRASSFTCYKIVQVMGKGFEEFSKDDLMNLINCVKKNREGELDEVAHQNAEDCYQTLWDICPMLL
ncbi:hypothetical protein TRFO_33215 [Tritrichomonas foetus]|uniref:RNA polymerase II assembly factor Rtp1 C-terminal domain-containing protein n=1 Tax=Tritrichomonas foetus TaxID=1144522 RepID=A0A1J4JP39_9EUKA|nr:hypothetical protein TRFO_33215 [Tritrichomonas foetus]|eukprot:OHT00184.1 hypothetical protein TRFO_33215 [Tritrichomonas foetus]